MSGPARLSALGVALLGVSVAACAGIVGADFSDVHGTSGSGISIDGGNVIPPGDDSGKPPNTSEDSGQPIIVADGGVCPTGYTNCGGDCFDLKADPGNCNACGHVCPGDPSGKGGPACLSGACTYTCPDGYEVCAQNAGCCLPATPDAGKDSGTPEPGILCEQTAGTPHYCPIGGGGFCCGDAQTGGDQCGQTGSQLECQYVFACSSGDQCAGTGAPACCYDTNPYDEDPTDDQNGQSSLCLASCSTGDGIPYIQFCNPAESGVCPAGTSCTGTFSGGGQLVTTYHYCE